MVGNDGEDPLALVLDPWGDEYRILPKELCIVVAHSSARDGSWSGTQLGDEPFSVGHGPDCVTVWVNANCFHLRDRNGNEIAPYPYGGCPAEDSAA